MSPVKRNLLFLSLLALLILFFVLDLTIGSFNLGLKEIFRILRGAGENELAGRVLLDFRLPRALTAVLAGMALATSGLQMQTLFRNPLAGPYVLGLSSGAGLGVALLVLGMPMLRTIGSLPSSFSIMFSASVGAGAVMLVMLIVSFKVRDVLTLLILGMLVGGALSSIISILQYFTNESALRIFVIWTMGSLGGVNRAQLEVLVPSVLLGCLLAFMAVKMLNGLLLGEEAARSLGVNIVFARSIVFISTSILAGTITAFCGPIGFVGVAVPHLARMLFNTSDHKLLLPASILCGALMMLLSDILSQLPGSGTILPINAVTSLLGIPVIIWIIIRNSAGVGR